MDLPKLEDELVTEIEELHAKIQEKDAEILRLKRSIQSQHTRPPLGETLSRPKNKTE